MFEGNPEIIAARRAVEASRADAVSAGARPNPTLSVGVSSINPSRGIGSGPLNRRTVDSAVRIDQLIERGGKRDLRMALAARLEAASVLDLEQTIRRQRLAVRTAWFDLSAAQERSRIAAEAAELFQRSVIAAERRLAAGDIAAAEVSRIRVDALRAAGDARATESERRRAQVVLALLIGLEAGYAQISAAGAWPDLGLSPEPAGEQAGDAQLDALAEIRAARERVEVALRARELARSLRTRDVSVGAQYDHYPVGETNQLGSGNSFGVFVSIPLFVNYQYDGEIRRAEVEYLGAQEALARARAAARAEIERAAGDQRAATEQAARFERTLAEAGTAARAAEFAYERGALPIMDLLDARRTLRALQIEAAAARADQARAWALWRGAIGE